MVINTEGKVILLTQLIYEVKHGLELSAELVETIKKFLFTDEEILVWTFEQNKIELWLIPSLPPEFATPCCVFHTFSFREALPVIDSLQKLELCSVIRAKFDSLGS